MRDYIDTINEIWDRSDDFDGKTLSEVKAMISSRLEDNDIGESEREELLDQFGLLDDMCRRCGRDTTRRYAPTLVTTPPVYR